MEKRKNIWKVIVCVVLLAVIFGGYLYAKREIHRIIEPRKDDFTWVYQVDSTDVEEKDLVIRGFAFELKKDAEKGAFDIVLQDIETGKYIFPKMQYSQREDVNNYFLCEFDYLNSGFTARIKADKLDLQNGNYEVLLQVGGTRKAYQTGTYLSKGKIMYVNPNEYAPLEVAGTDLEEIVENGVLRVYRPDVGMYVYQYEGELYWIAEPDYGFVDGDTYVQYQLNTTQIDRLPEERLQNNWFWSNIGFKFTTKELTEWNTEKKRVAKCTLPTDYSITRIWTGNHVDDWIWIQYFRPHYYFQ